MKTRVAVMGMGRICALAVGLALGLSPVAGRGADKQGERHRVDRGVSASVPNGYATMSAVDMRLMSTAGEVRWMRTWDGQEWKFQPQWEGLSQSWKNLTGSQSADTTGGTTGGGTDANLIGTGPDGPPPDSGAGCWVWVDEDWQPTVGTTLIDGIPEADPMPPARTTPFNRKMESEGGEYPPVRRVSVDYAALCVGFGVTFVDAEGIRSINQLFLGEGGRYAFDNRTVLEKRAVQQLPSADAASLYSQLATGRITLGLQTNDKGFRKIDRSGEWIDYNTQGQIVAYGDRNDNSVRMLRDNDGTLRGVVDGNGRVLWSLHYSGSGAQQLLTEIKDYPASGIEGDLPSRSVQYQYDDKNRLIKVTDVRGHATQYAYDVANRIVKITDPEGRATQLSYNGDNTVKTRTAADGGVTDYAFEYDDTNKQFISKIIGPETAAGRRVDDITQNRAGKLVRRIVNGRTEEEIRYDTASRTEIHTNVRGFVTRTTRNEFDQAIQVVNPQGGIAQVAYSALHLGPTEATDPLGIKTQHQYDAKGNVLKTIEAVGTADERITEYTRNSLGQVTHITSKGRTEQSGSVTPDATWQISYDAQGHITQTTDPEGHTRSYQYDRRGHLIRYTDPLGNTTRYEVDAAGQLRKVTDPLGRVRTYEHDKVGNVTQATDARGHAVQISYDALNRRLDLTNRVGGVHKLSYNAAGLPVTETDEDGRSSQAEFDNFLRITRQTDGLGNITQFGYVVPDGSPGGAVGALVSPTQITYPTFTQELRYDSLERPTSKTLLNPNSLGTEGLVSGSTYDKRGQVLSRTDAHGKTTAYRYDALGRLIETTNSLGHKTLAQYDARGNLIQITDAQGKVSRFAFDRNNRIVQSTLPMGQTTQYQYDAAGNLTQQIDPNGHKTQISFDAANRLVQIKRWQAGGTLVRTTTATWDLEDNLSAWTDTDHSRNQTSSGARTHDAAGRQTQETITYPGGTTLGYQYSYSPAGNKTRLTWADGTAIDYSYTAHGLLQTVAIAGEGNLSVTAYKWLAPSQITLPGGGTQTRQLDGLLHLEDLKVKTPGQQTVLSLVNTWGKVQELKTQARSDTVGGTTSSQSGSFSYDDETRLTQAQTSAGGNTATETYTLDALGNRIAHSQVSGAWEYDDNHRLTRKGSGNCGQSGVTCYQYDEAGNLTQKQTASQTRRYRYDTQNRLIQVQDGNDEPIARYGYDPLDRRIWKEQFRDASAQPLPQAQRTLYLYAHEGLIAEATQAIELGQGGITIDLSEPQITTQYGLWPDGQWGSGPLFIKTRNSNGQASYAYYHHDHRQTPVQATDKAGNIVWAANYNAFGKASITTPAPSADKPVITSQLRLPGQYEDPESGLYYNYRRYYDPETGRYISQDPIGLAGGLNRYRYAEADPINQIDPTGELALPLAPLAWGAARCMAGCMAGAGLWNAVFGSCDDLGDVTRNCALECAGGWALGKLFGKLRGLGGPPLPCEINSFTGDTVVHVKPSGASQQDAQQGQATLKAISQLQVGDEVLALAEWKDKGTQAQQDQRLSYEKVTDIFTSFKEQTLVHLTLANGQQLSATEGHPFLTTEGWRDAVMLKKGGKLLLKGGEEDSEPALEITEIRTERKTLPVYNIEVANAHTYFVGIDGVVVHNAGFVFRGDGRPPNVIFDEGFAPRGPNEDLLKYARDNVPSIYVGTSKSPIVARFFAYKEYGYAYTIRWPANGIDVNEVLGPESPHLRELEIAVPGAIKPSEIMGCRRVRGNRMVGPFIKNPNWVP